MKIAVWHNLPSGGGKRALYDHVRGLTARGHHIEVWCPPSADLTYMPLAGFAREHVVPLDWPQKRNLKDLARLRFSMERSVRAMDEHCRRCAEEIERGGFDVLYANACQFFRTTAIGRAVDIPSTIYLGEPYRWLYEAMPRLTWLAPPPPPGARYNPARFPAWYADQRRIASARLQAREEYDNARGFDRILVNSFFSRESVLRAYGLDSQVCYLGTDTAHFVDKHLPREDFVVGLGAVTPEKNPMLAIRALAALPAPRPALVWIGNIAYPGYHDEVVALAAASGVELRLRLRIEDAELVDLLNRATAMIYAPRLEPFGLAPIEAAACGLPVVAVAEGGVRETVIDGVTGLHVDNDPVAVAAAISRLRQDPALRDRLGAQARENVERRWSFAAGIDRIEEKLGAIANGGRVAENARRDAVPA